MTCLTCVCNADIGQSDFGRHRHDISQKGALAYPCYRLRPSQLSLKRSIVSWTVIATGSSYYTCENGYLPFTISRTGCVSYVISIFTGRLVFGSLIITATTRKLEILGLLWIHRLGEFGCIEHPGTWDVRKPINATMSSRSTDITEATVLVYDPDKHYLTNLLLQGG